MVEDSLIKKQFFEIVNNYIKNDKLSHAYLIEVNNYDDDFAVVLEFVKMILCNCTREKLENDKSNISDLIDNSNYPDLKIIEADGQWIKKSQLLELIGEFQNKSLLDNKRIYIIKEAEKLNSSSANTILKFLEEPEEGIVAILLTKNRFQVIETILSRCQTLTLAASDDCICLSDNSKLLLEYIVKREELFINYNKIITDIIPDKVQAKVVFNDISQVIINFINFNSNRVYDGNKEIINILQKADLNYLVSILSIIEEEFVKLEYNINYKLWLDALFARFIIGG